LKDWRPKVDAPVVEMLKKAGAIVIAKTNMPEMAFRGNGECKLYGNCLNPHDLGRSPGGSSSGTAAAIASGVASCGLGSDTMGSCRLPAEACGIAGFRPSLGRYDGEGIIPLFKDRDTIGLLGATVSDIALLDSVIMDYNFKKEYKFDVRHTFVRPNLSSITIGVPTSWVKDCFSKPNLEAL
jgi:mandelamide amidase